MAEVSGDRLITHVADVATHVSPMSRLMTVVEMRGLEPLTPAEAYRSTAKAMVTGTRAAAHFRLRYDIADTKGAITLRRAGRLHHLKIGAAHARRRVLAIADEQAVTVVALDTGEILSTHLIEPDRRYWRNQRRDPGRWPRSRTSG